MGVGMTGWGQDTTRWGQDTTRWGQDTTRWEKGMEAAARKMNGAAMGRTSSNNRPAQLCNSPPTITPEAIFVIPVTPPRHSRVGGNPISLPPNTRTHADDDATNRAAAQIWKKGGRGCRVVAERRT